MSHSIVYLLNYKTGIEESIELHKSSGSCCIIWDTLCQLYFNSKPYEYVRDGSLEKLWPLYKDKNMPENHRAMLLMTCDFMYVAKKNYGRAGKEIKKWLIDFPPIEGYANHWPEIMKIYQLKPECDAIGLYCTSVSENLFENIKWNLFNEVFEEVDIKRKNQ